MKVPSWLECSTKIDDGIAVTPLEKFVFNNEPAGTRHEALFRKQLQDVLDYAEAESGREEQANHERREDEERHFERQRREEGR